LGRLGFRVEGLGTSLGIERGSSFGAFRVQGLGFRYVTRYRKGIKFWGGFHGAFYRAVCPTSAIYAQQFVQHSKILERRALHTDPQNLKP
jgi:hypothetical protein